MSYESTPGRVTQVRIDPPFSDAIQLPMAQERSCEEMVRGSASSADGLWLRPHSGWQLSPYQRFPSNQQELTQLQSAIWSSNLLQCPSGWVQIPKFYPVQETGVDYGSGVVTNGDLFWDKQVKAGDDWSSGTYQILSDGATFLGPLDSKTNAPLDRVGLGTATLAADQSFFLRFQLLGIRASSPDYVIGIGFGGPAGLTVGGVGQYYIGFGGDGRARLYEGNGADGWQLVTEFGYCNRHQTVSMMHMIHVSPSLATLDRSLAGSIVIECTSTSEGLPTHYHFARGTVPRTDQRVVALAVPISNATYSPCPMRIDVRRDLRVQYQIASPVYPPSATLIDDPFSFPFLPNSSVPLILAWFSNPFGASQILGSLYDASSGSALVQSGSAGDFPQFTPNSQSRYLQAKFTFTGDGSSTPTLFDYRVQTDGIAEPSIEAESDWQSQTVLIEAISESADAGFDRAIIRLNDLEGNGSSLQKYAGHRLRLDVSTSETGLPITTNLFAGWIDEIESVIKGSVTGNAFPVARFAEYELSAIGMWSRLARAVSPIRFNYGLDFNSIDGQGKPQPYLVTDALTSLFSLAGFPASMVNLPSLSIRLHSASDTQGWILAPQASISEFISRLASEFFGGVILFDPNIGSDGQWRIVASSPTTAPIATFVTAPASGKLVHRLEAYPFGTGFIRKGSLSIVTQPPAANMVVGYGLTGAIGHHATPSLLKQSYVNIASFPFLGSNVAQPSSLDYLGYCQPLFVFLPHCSHSTRSAIGK